MKDGIFMMKWKKGLFLCAMCIILSACSAANGSREKKEVSPEDRILMVEGKLYYGTAEIGPMGDSGSVGGEIQSSVNEDELPSEEGQSNFGGIGNSYTWDTGNGGIMVFIEDEWYWFYTDD